MNKSEEDFKHNQEKLQPLKSKDRASQLVQSVSKCLESDIWAGSLTIPEEEKKLVIMQKQQLENNESKLQEIADKKKQIAKQLELMKREEEQLKIKLLEKSKIQENTTKMFKSEMTSEDVEKLKNLHAAQRKFQKQLEEKTRRHEEKMKRIKQEEEEALKQQSKLKFEKKKQEAEKTIELIEKRKEERRLKSQDQKKNLIEIKNRRKIHEEMRDRWKETEDDEERKKLQMKEQLRKMKQIDFGEIKEHEKKYQEAIKMHKESRVKNSAVKDFDSGRQAYHSSFLEIIREQNEQRKQMEELKKKIPKDFAEKKKEYAEQVRVNYKPEVRVKAKNDDQEQKKSDLNISRSLSLFETHQKGNEYMRTINSQIAEVLKNKDVNSSAHKQQVKPFKHINYLSEMRRKNDSEAGSITQSKMSEIKKIMTKQNMTQEQKFYQAKMLAEKMENRKVVKSNKNLVESINVKLEILKQMKE